MEKRLKKNVLSNERLLAAPKVLRINVNKIGSRYRISFRLTSNSFAAIIFLIFYFFHRSFRLYLDVYNL